MRNRTCPIFRTAVAVVAIVLCISTCSGMVAAAEQPGANPSVPPTAVGGAALPWQPIAKMIGRRLRHRIAAGETLLDIARRYDLGYNELEDLYPAVDPWLLPAGAVMTIPAQRILPSPVTRGIVINIPEMRLYFYDFVDRRPMVTTFPIGIGGSDFPTPVGSFGITSKRVHPTWFIPPSLRTKYRGITSIPPGPDNPLGDYWMRLGDSMYGIHGTNFPWSVGRMATHGCIRLYPEDIKRLFAVVQPGTEVRLVYQPVKVAVIAGRIFLEVHRDVYGMRGDLRQDGEALLAEKGLVDRVDRRRFDRALREHSGMAVEITPGSAPSPSPAHPPDF